MLGFEERHDYSMEQITVQSTISAMFCSLCVKEYFAGAHIHADMGGDKGNNVASRPAKRPTAAHLWSPGPS